ncbi:glycosyltransferase, partial [Campylobacter jejuni]|nr:glycosyltransferase [Campylobacter jejuni]
LIADELTYASLKEEDGVVLRNVTPINYKVLFYFWKPDFLFVESAWHGCKNKWKYQIASYPDYPKRNNKKLQKCVDFAKTLNIPTVFWNKEDHVHFDRFIESAKLFDFIFTVDENCISKYKSYVGENSFVGVLPFAVQSKFHNFTGFNFTLNKANFVGSYSRHIHEKRRFYQDMMFKLSSEINNLDVFDRNSNRKSTNYRYPIFKGMQIYPSVEYKKTAQIYKKYLISLNVNTIENSPTMFSRRLIEIIACGGIAITNHTSAVEKYFKDYCYSFQTEKELRNMLYKFQKNGLSEDDKIKLKNGAEFIAKNHTWKQRLEQIVDTIGIKKC